MQRSPAVAPPAPTSPAIAWNKRSAAPEPLRVITKCETCAARPHTICSAIALNDLERLSSIAVTMNLSPGHRFIQEGTAAKYFFNVTAGNARIFKETPDGRRLVTGFARLGHFLGLAGAALYSFSAEAIDDVLICRYSRPKLTALLAEFPALESRLLQIASSELVDAQEQMLLLGRKSAHERLASFLLGLATGPAHAESQPFPFAGSSTGSIVLPMTRNDIADYLGLTIETVSRTFTRLRLDGIIAMPAPSRVTIRDRAALDEMASGN